MPSTERSWTRCPTGTAAQRERDHFIPARKSDILRALLDHDALGGRARSATSFARSAGCSRAIYHYEYFDQLERMRDDYFYFNPEHDSRARFDAATIEQAYRDLTDAADGVLHGANFIEVPHEEIERAHREHALVPVEHRGARSTTTATSGSSAAAITGRRSRSPNGSAGASAASKPTSMTTSC